ncbi:phosphoribosyl-ATP pyrophosphohydrolase [Candidatus Falkowbacteria bacterium RIFOXYD2_FULL_35_9]|uniref:Phosphoribosyl-ATP pyrophosphohydrolase n=1 Tax=Candidatus Falkowbacteria bacterium RIFOXYC2_FULL_36_12 TaxID=1798002 RepID=A0A1F5SYP4_9BACT|nr:MAG: phosphoribosyl-ATP pyrophosphohydrolase [Candidatus Falkowbacteria bacterium RIFOXYB2_FULL_35_7]OGF31820.1 MAG: phosphoribosyl-ATP pyrophosphohydrolase [Candidatus Falkowbacteria bacterium RIFOXYC2_FULL_36_12]OGF33772.1 MAG: phosphoribosyl-ATP pyrophosphohydrolase [Candidatus Falkowbacteria bacterium RIFOXYA2_FULL_35_8]OGF46304.1 MAG: phosphoribosyl-ATP pyrophosphohydrolase [Candidatus Falkowbacteria bacterium RIFOXYD2_FULL_35_9]
MIHNKLVRDLIPQIIEDDGDEAVTRVLEDDEYYQALKDKLLEEVEEYLESDDHEELADVLEVIRALVDYHSMTYEDLENTRKMKLQERGGFSERIFLSEVIEN